MVHNQFHNVRQEDDAKAFIQLYSRASAPVRTRDEKVGLVRMTFLIWRSRSPTVLDFFVAAKQPLLLSLDDVFRFISRHDKTAETRFRSAQGPGQNAELCLSLLNTFDGPRLEHLRSVTAATTPAEAMKAMIALREWGGEDSTRYLIKNMLAPLGIADSSLTRTLLKWTSNSGDLILSGPNCNKFLSMWEGQERSHAALAKRIVSCEASLRALAVRLRRKLPTRVVVRRDGKARRIVLRRVNFAKMQENACMGSHCTQFLLSGRSGPRDTRKV